VKKQAIGVEFKDFGHGKQSCNVLFSLANEMQS